MNTGMNTGYSVKASADKLGITPRTLRRWIKAGDGVGAWQEKTKHGDAWRIPADALDQLRNRCAHDVETVPTIERESAEVQPFEDTAPPANETGVQLAPLDGAGAMLALIEAVQASTTAAADREREASARETEAWRRTIDDQADTVAHLRQMLELAEQALADERFAHADTRREVSLLRTMLGTRTRPTVPLRVVEGGER